MPTYPNKTNTVSSSTRTLGLTGKTAGSVIYDEGSNNTKPLTQRQNELVYKTIPASKSKNDPEGPGSGYGSGSGAGGDYGYYDSGATAPTTSYWEDIVKKIKGYLQEQYDQANKQSKTLYEQRLANNKQAYETDRNQSNLNFLRTQRYLNNQYGDAVSGMGLTNKARNYQNWNNNLSKIRTNYTNNDASALSDYNANLSNNAQTLAQGWYNYVLPIYTNRQQQLDDMEYRKYLASIQ